MRKIIGAIAYGSVLLAGGQDVVEDRLKIFRSIENLTLGTCHLDTAKTIYARARAVPQQSDYGGPARKF